MGSLGTVTGGALGGGVGLDATGSTVFETAVITGATRLVVRVTELTTRVTGLTVLTPDTTALVTGLTTFETVLVTVDDGVAGDGAGVLVEAAAAVAAGVDPGVSLVGGGLLAAVVGVTVVGAGVRAPVTGATAEDTVSETEPMRPPLLCAADALAGTESPTTLTAQTAKSDEALLAFDPTEGAVIWRRLDGGVTRTALLRTTLCALCYTYRSEAAKPNTTCV